MGLLLSVPIAASLTSSQFQLHAPCSTYTFHRADSLYDGETIFLFKSGNFVVFESPSVSAAIKSDEGGKYEADVLESEVSVKPFAVVIPRFSDRVSNSDFDCKKERKAVRKDKRVLLSCSAVRTGRIFLSEISQKKGLLWFDTLCGHGAVVCRMVLTQGRGLLTGINVSGIF